MKDMKQPEFSEKAIDLSWSVWEKLKKLLSQKGLSLEVPNASPGLSNNFMYVWKKNDHYLECEIFENGEIEVKVYSQLQDPKPYNGIAGFIGVYFRIHPEDNAFDGIYLRPKAGSSKDQLVRNHTVQYIAYPDAKFDMLRKRAPFKYEGAAPVVLNEWITMRIVVNGNQAELFINSIKHAIFSVDQLLSTNQKGGVGLYVDIGTVGYFKDLKVIKKPYVPVNTKGNEVKGI